MTHLPDLPLIKMARVCFISICLSCSKRLFTINVLQCGKILEKGLGFNVKVGAIHVFMDYKSLCIFISHFHKEKYSWLKLYTQWLRNTIYESGFIFISHPQSRLLHANPDHFQDSFTKKVRKKMTKWKHCHILK